MEHVDQAQGLAGAATIRERFVAEVLSGLEPASGGLSAEHLTTFVTAFVARTETALLGDPVKVARLVAAQLEAGRSRVVGTDTLRIDTPSEDPSGSTYVLIVTDDRPFLVDTVTMELTRRGWSIRHLYHPQFRVTRDAEGVLTGVWARGTGGAGIAESWMAVEAYGPLGSSAEALTPDLRAALAQGLDAVRHAVEDWHPMLARMEECVRKLDETAQPVSPYDVRQATDLLRWLAEDHFAFLGYREYKVRAGTFTPVPGTGLGILRGDADEPGTFHAVPRPGAPEVLVLTKDTRRSPVHRPAYLDYVGIRIHDARGRLVGERRFLGLLSASAYTDSVTRIPLLRAKAAELMRRSGYGLDSHAGHALAQVIDGYPRDELFHASVEELFDIVDVVAGLQERRQVRLFVRPGTYGHFVSCLVYLPRDRYNTEVRLRIQEVLMAAFGGESLEYQASVTESVLARLVFVIKLPDGAPVPGYDVAALEAELTEAARHWEDAFADLAEQLPSAERGVDFGDAYEASYTPRQALADLQLANALTDAADLRFALYAPDDPTDPADLRFKVLSRAKMSLTKMMPHLSALGVDVVDERPYEWSLRGEPLYVYDFGFRLPAGQTLADWNLADRARFAAAFDASWRGLAFPGRLNRLVMQAGLTWVQVSWLRGLSRYLQQAGIPFSQTYVAKALTANPGIARLLVAAFEERFDPASGADLATRAAAFEVRAAEIEAALDGVRSLDQDRIIRMFLAVLRSMVRTNAFAADAPALAFKLRPGDLPLLPEPRAAFEIFVASTRVEGVHMRFGTVARGGLRWSDRKEDFRTEVLGLAKAQMVKNTVIVPVGAKGGFVPQRLPDPTVDRQAWFDEGVACYRLFIGSLLSITDNIVGGAVVPPPDVVRYDGDDPYLVVAADKGTATFSDYANAIAVERGFWLGDAFASGGSAGYDHKAMGITARGAWESVKRHFFEAGLDCQTTDFTCVGIGDMAGDVFGNGMLLSEHTRLVAAFNHAHVFLDPDPDAAASFVERRRLFELPRSTWADYDPALISEGGGVFERSAKAIPISAQVRRALGIASDAATLTPTELIAAILSAPVDLLWNGGIGTYVKASDETHADAGDKANDAVRVDGNQVRAKVAGEGGNLGWTQRGRIEYARHGGRINTDFIDNSAGVDTSDHEVNIKILLAAVVERGDLGVAERNALLASMTDEVAHLVLQHNVDSNRALADAESRSLSLVGAHAAWMGELEASGHLDRTLEALPTDAALAQRAAGGRGLTRPELASLFAWTKIRLEELILASDLPEDPYLADRLTTYFPKALREPYGADMSHHRLHREIVTMVTVNRFVNSMGITAYHRLATETGADVGRIVRAQLAARTIFAVARTELAVAHATGVAANADVGVRDALQHLVERATRWLLHNRRAGLDIRAEAARFTDPVAAVAEAVPGLLTPGQAERFEALADSYVAGGLDGALARRTAAAEFTHEALPIVQVATDTDRDALAVAAVWFAVAERLGLDAVGDRVDALPHLDRWETMARAALRDDLAGLHERLVREVLGVEAADAAGAVDGWLSGRPDADAALSTLRLAAGTDADLARLSVALRTIRSLVG